MCRLSTWKYYCTVHTVPDVSRFLELPGSLDGLLKDIRIVHEAFKGLVQEQRGGLNVDEAMAFCGSCLGDRLRCDCLRFWALSSVECRTSLSFHAIPIEWMILRNDTMHNCCRL